MSRDATFRLLVLVCLTLLAYLVWLNTREIVALEVEVDRVRGALAPSNKAKEDPRNKAKEDPLRRIAQGSFEESLRAE